MKKTNYINQLSILLFMLCSIAASATGISPRSIDKRKCIKLSDHATDQISTITDADFKAITEFNF